MPRRPAAGYRSSPVAGCHREAPPRTSFAASGDSCLDAAREAASPPAQAAVDPCDLITRDAAAQLLGEPMLEGERREEGRAGMTLCLYNPADPDSLAFLQVSINQPGGTSSGVSPAQIFQDIRDAMGDGRPDLDGLDDANKFR